jgi:putative ubiquitin-RnfH superfamily antitoxin RatB of RatAB toxin-antitoxin module
MPEPEVLPLQVTVAWSDGPRQVHERVLCLQAGSTVLQALQASGALQGPGMDPQLLAIGVWGRKARLGQLLRDKDRVEIYRPLLVDPKVARRERFQKQGARTTGLFANKRPGAKQGY